MTVTELEHYADIAEGMGSRDMANALRTADREIERLRNELAAKAPYFGHPDIIDLTQAKRLIAQYSGELAKLRAELDKERQRRFDGNQIASEEARNESREQQSEIERLRAELDEQRSGLRAALSGNNPEKWIWLGNNELKRVLAERDVLRAEPVAGWGQIAPDGVVEALQRLIENGATLGPASAEDALLVARYRQSLLAPQPAILDGFVLVPKEPTVEMIAAGERERMSHPGNMNPCTTWVAMIAAAPKPGDAA